MRRRILNRLGLLAVAASLAVMGQASIAHAEFGVTPENFKTDLVGPEAGLAGAPADYHIGFKLNTVTTSPFSPPEGTAKQADVELPPGLIGDPTEVPSCSMVLINANGTQPRCPADRAVGYAVTKIYIPTTKFALNWTSRVYRTDAKADEAAAFAFPVFNTFPIRISVSVDPENGYRITSRALNINEGLPPISTDLTLWGIPQDHTAPGPLTEINAGTFGSPQPLSVPRTRFLSTPTNCQRSSLDTTLTLTSWQTKQPLAPISSSMPGVTGCEELSFDPSIDVTPENLRAGAPSGYRVELTLPQNDDPYGRLTPSLKDAVVRLPAGLAISPPQADGLGACSDQQLGLHTAAAAACPDSSKIGSLSIDTPLLEAPLAGSVFLGSQLSSDPESGQMYRIFLVAEGPGTLIKLSGAIVANRHTGQLTATFNQNPELPFSKLTLNLNGGDRASLVNPTRCGNYTTTASLASWAGQLVNTAGAFGITQDCGAQSRFAPGFEAGTVDPSAGSFAPFALRVTRADGQQNVSRIDTALPEGLLAKLAGVPPCGDVAAASGSCPFASQIGVATVGTGGGASPLYLPQPGKAPTAVYLAGPYKGAPYSLVVKIPAQAGPFDLGTVAVRSAISVDPITTQVSVQSDPLPQILGGVPIAYRDIRVNVNRPGFMLNPTSCAPMSVAGTVVSALGAAAHASSPFQTVNCERLAFKPKLALRFFGKTNRSAHPRLKATLKAAPGQANIGKAVVLMPKTELLENAHIRTICTRDQWAADSCPKGAIYGYAKAWTPLLDQRLQGPVYLRSNGGARELPDLVADLKGQIDIELVGYIDAVNARLRARFVSVPDAPVSRFVLNMKGGKKGLLVHNTNVCKRKPRATVKFDGQNGKVRDFKPVVKTSCKGKKKRSGAKKRAK